MFSSRGNSEEADRLSESPVCQGWVEVMKPLARTSVGSKWALTQAEGYRQSLSVGETSYVFLWLKCVSLLLPKASFNRFKAYLPHKNAAVFLVKIYWSVSCQLIFCWHSFSLHRKLFKSGDIMWHQWKKLGAKTSSTLKPQFPYMLNEVGGLIWKLW